MSDDHSSTMLPCSTCATATCKMRWRRVDNPDVSMSSTEKAGKSSRRPVREFDSGSTRDTPPP
jgi:hypothetical protein